MHPIADIAGDNAAHTITLAAASWVQFVVTGSGTVRISQQADNPPSATFGLPIAAGGGFMAAWRGPQNRFNPVWYAYIPSGATLSVAYAD